MLKFYSIKEDLIDDSEIELGDVLIPIKSGLNFRAEIDRLQKIIFERLA
jgi:hypothetical protein